jgi:alpha-1,3-mannosyltransferase
MGYQNDVCCLNRCARSKKNLKSFEVYDGIKIYRMPFLNLKLYKISPQVLNFVKRYDLIQIHSMGYLTDFLALTKFVHGKKMILNTHGGIFHTKSFSSLKRLYFNYWCRAAFKRIDRILADGENDGKTFSRISDNVEVIPITIDTEKFSNIKRAPEKNRLVYIGRVSKNKRIDHLINTVFYIKKNIPDIKLYVVGSDEKDLRKTLEGHVRERGLEKNVIFTGRVSDEELLDHLRKAQLYLFASEYEGGAIISVLEAMAAGVPAVVNSEIEETYKEWLINNKTGFIIDYRNHQKSAEIITKLLKKDKNKISENGKEMSKKYDWTEVVKRIGEIYEECL